MRACSLLAALGAPALAACSHPSPPPPVRSAEIAQIRLVRADGADTYCVHEAVRPRLLVIATMTDGAGDRITLHVDPRWRDLVRAIKLSARGGLGGAAGHAGDGWGRPREGLAGRDGTDGQIDAAVEEVSPWFGDRLAALQAPSSAASGLSENNGSTTIP